MQKHYITFNITKIQNNIENVKMSNMHRNNIGKRNKATVSYLKQI